jgi:short-subunit dehydrogenase
MTTPAARPLALITGATAGIGRVFAERLAAQGYDLLLVARDGVRLAEFATDIASRHGVQAEGLAADLSQDADTDRLIARIQGDARLTMLVNNAGFGTKGTLAKTDVGAQDRMLRLHMLAPARMTQAALPGMIGRKMGRIINVASVASWTTVPGGVNYSATKAYLRMFSEGLALELGGTGVRVQALCPGFTYSEFHDRAGVSRSMFPAWMWMTSESVVDASLAQIAADGATVCVPGAQYKVMVFLLKYFQWVLSPLRGRYKKD